MSGDRGHAYRELGRALLALLHTVSFLVVFVIALANYDHTATFGKLLALLAFWVLLDIADEVRKIRKAKGTP